MTAARLFDAPAVARARWTGNVLPVLARPVCPVSVCAAPLFTLRPAVQPALFFHGGYGAAERTTIRVCVACGWAGTAHVETLNPRHLGGPRP